MEWEIQMTAPRKIIMLPRVVIKPGIPIFATQKPFHAPTRTPIPIPSSTAAHQGKFHFWNAMAMTIPQKPATEPTDKSIWPMTMTISIPMARISTYALPDKRFWKLEGVIIFPSEAILKKTISAINAITIVYLCRSSPNTLLILFIRRFHPFLHYDFTSDVVVINRINFS